MRFIKLIFFIFFSCNVFAQIQGTGPGNQGNVPLHNLRHASGSNFVIKSGVGGKAEWAKDSIYFGKYWSVASAPLGAKKGDFWRSTANQNTYFWDGIDWRLIAKTDADTSEINELIESVVYSNGFLSIQDKGAVYNIDLRDTLFGTIDTTGLVNLIKAVAPIRKDTLFGTVDTTGLRNFVRNQASAVDKFSTFQNIGGTSAVITFSDGTQILGSPFIQDGIQIVYDVDQAGYVFKYYESDGIIGNETGRLWLSNDSIYYKKAPDSLTIGFKLLPWLQDSLNARSRIGHNHVINDIAFLQDNLNLKSNINHTHTIGNVTGLQDSLNARANETTATIQAKRPLKTIESQSLEGSGNIDLVKADVGLSNVDNTSDLNKPISTATQTALNSIDTSKWNSGSVLSPKNLSLNLGIGTNNTLGHRLAVNGSIYSSAFLDIKGIPLGSNAFDQMTKGIGAGNGATNAAFSNFFGFNAGNGATNASNSNFFGQAAGLNGVEASLSNFFGFNAGNGATNAVNSNFFGQAAGNGALNSNNSNFFGTNAGNGATNSRSSNFFGQSAGLNASNAPFSNFFGTNTGNGATNANYSNFFGQSAGLNAINAEYSNFFGLNAGNGSVNARFSNFFGYNTGSSGIGHNNILIGTGVTLPDGRNNSMNIGSVLFGTGFWYNDIRNSTGSEGGRIGILTNAPQNTLDVNGDVRIVNRTGIAANGASFDNTGKLVQTTGLNLGRLNEIEKYGTSEIINSNPNYTDRDGANFAVKGDTIHVFGGWDNSGTLADNHYSSNDGGITWQTNSNKGFGPRHTFGLEKLGNYYYIFGTDYQAGVNSRNKGVWRSLDLFTWTEINADPPFGYTWNYGATTHNGYLYLIGGHEFGMGSVSPNKVNKLWKSNDGITWTELSGTLPEGGGMLNGQVISHLGALWIAFPSNYSDVLNDRIISNKIYKSIDDGVTWVETGSHPFPSQYGTLFKHKDKVYYRSGHHATLYNTNKLYYTYDMINWREILDHGLPLSHAVTIGIYKNNIYELAGSLYNDIRKINIIQAIPLYETTSAAVSDTTLQAGAIFKTSNNNGSSQLYIKD